MTEIPISLEVPIEDLDIKYNIDTFDDPEDVWSSLQKVRAEDVSIIAIFYNDQEVVDYSSYSEIIDWIVEKENSKWD